MAKNNRKKVVVVVRMEAEKRAWLKQRSAETGETMTDLLMNALGAEIKRESPAAFARAGFKDRESTLTQIDECIRALQNMRAACGQRAAP